MFLRPSLSPLEDSRGGSATSAATTTAVLDPSVAIDVALREIEAFVARIRRATPSDLTRPTRCAEWTVDDLARHFAAVVWQQAEAFHRARLDISEPPSYLRIDRDDVAEAIETATDHLVLALDLLADHDAAPVPLPFAPGIPAVLAVHGLIVEYGLHRNDLDWAFGDRVDLPGDVAGVIIDLLPAMLPMLAAADAPAARCYRLETGSRSVSVAWVGDQWRSIQSPEAPTCTVRGRDSDIALLSVGRLPIDHAAFDVDDPAGIAAQFHEFFPGM